MGQLQEGGVDRDRVLRPSSGISPVGICRGTVQIMDLYRRDLLGNDDGHAKDFLLGPTTSYLWEAEQGLLKNIGRFGRRRSISMEYLNKLLDAFPHHNPEPNQEETEAFDFGMVVFSVMPAMAHFPYLPRGFSRRGALAPPFTSIECLGRFREMRSEVLKIVSGQTTPRTLPSINHPLFRTKTFFEVASSLPDMYKDNPRVITDRSKEMFERLLGDVVIDFDPPAPVQ